MEINILTGTLLETNNYIIETENKIVLIEASANLLSVKNYVKNKKVVAILLTHGHWDHYINVEKVAQEFNCPIYMSKQAFVKINSKEKAFYADRNPKIDLNNFQINFIQDGDILDFGDELKFEVIETPGHTDCSVCYLLKASNETILFSGDTLFNDGIGRTDLPTGNNKQMNQSLKKILMLPEKTLVLPGHGEATELKIEKTNLINILK